METNYSVYNILSNINVNNYTEEKNGLTYLSWAWAWAKIKENYPDATYTIYENKDGWNYFTDGRTGWVKTGVTIGGIEYIEYLPIMDYKNKSIKLEDITSFDVNKAIQRSLTKASARHGLGLYIYAGEDLPESEKVEESKKKEEPNKPEMSDKDIINEYDRLYKELLGLGYDFGFDPKVREFVSKQTGVVIDDNYIFDSLNKIEKMKILVALQKMLNAAIAKKGK